MMFWLISPCWLLLSVLVVLNHVSHHLVAISLLIMKLVESRSLDSFRFSMLQSMLVPYFPPSSHLSFAKKLNVSNVKIVSSLPSWFQPFWCLWQFWHSYLENHTTSQTSHLGIFSFHFVEQLGLDSVENANRKRKKNISWIMLLMQAILPALFKISRLELKIYSISYRQSLTRLSQWPSQGIVLSSNDSMFIQSLLCSYHYHFSGLYLICKDQDGQFLQPKWMDGKEEINSRWDRIRFKS